jgi:glucosamine--fructose-6-phosphate aminotransferase (isomerizing)
MGLMDVQRPPGNRGSLQAEDTRMFAEAAQGVDVVAAQLDRNNDVLRALGGRLRKRPPRAVVTLGRGSSDHAATFARYLIETRTGVITASASPSVSSVYDARLAMDEVLCLAISQSGRSPDLLAAVDAAKAAGATVAALVNDDASPLASRADVLVPLCAGPELSVAATKSYIAALSAAAQLVAWWTEDDALQSALAGLPALLDAAWSEPWRAAQARLVGARSLYVLGRGLGFGIAQEAALKFKETCGLHAEAFSAAELSHGPMALVGAGFPVLAFAQDDETRAGVEAAVAACAAKGAEVMQAGGGEQPGVCRLATRPATHPVAELIGFVQSFYRMACELAVGRGFDPDRPPHLSKVTETR